MKKTTTPATTPKTARSKAYLVARFDVSRRKPSLYGVDIYSEAEPTLAPGRPMWQTVVLETEGHDYESAYHKVIKTAMTHPYYAWTRPYVRQAVEHSVRHKARTQEIPVLACPVCGGPLCRIRHAVVHNAYGCGSCGGVFRMPQRIVEYGPGWRIDRG